MTSTAAEFKTKPLDVLGLYVTSENALVLSVDEKTTIPAMDRTQPMLPLRPGQVVRRSFAYMRNGTSSLNAARHHHQEFLDSLRLLGRTYRGQDLHLIVDNLSAYKHQNVTRWLRRHATSTCTSHQPTLHGSTK